LAVIIDDSGMESVFGDIDAAEECRHESTSDDKMRTEAGTAARSILHRDEGSRTQPTYEEFGGQGTDLRVGSVTQGVGSPPASSSLSISRIPSRRGQGDRNQ
jgi:hypothetical protein